MCMCMIIMHIMRKGGCAPCSILHSQDIPSACCMHGKAEGQYSLQHLALVGSPNKTATEQ